VIVAVTGTGTGIGKTHVACALVTALRARGLRAVGWKPVESGVAAVPGGGPATDSDEHRLAEASGTSPAPTLRLRAALSPHLAARRERVTIDGVAIRATLDELAARWEIVVLELAGGLCSPFDDTRDNAEWLAEIPGLRVIVVAPDRLGVLHDVVATVRAAGQIGIGIDAIAIVAPAEPDASTGSNAIELRARAVIGKRPVIDLPRGSVSELAEHAELARLAELLRDDRRGR